jgi:hypothetical protein
MRQSTRPARACSIPPTSAETALTAMFRPRGGGGVPRGDEHRGQAQASEHEAHHRAEEGGGEGARGRDREVECVHARCFYRTRRRGRREVRIRRTSFTVPSRSATDTAHLPG